MRAIAGALKWQTTRNGAKVRFLRRRCVLNGSWLAGMAIDEATMEALRGELDKAIAE